MKITLSTDIYMCVCNFGPMDKFVLKSLARGQEDPKMLTKA